MDGWEWFAGTFTVRDLAGVLGAGLLIFLFARDLILTKGQHERRVADIRAGYAELIAEKDRTHENAIVALTEYHRQIVAAKDERNAELDESRKWWRDAHNLQRDRGDQALEVAATAGIAAADIAGKIVGSAVELAEEGASA